jgi:hypothetical protein
MLCLQESTGPLTILHSDYRADMDLASGKLEERLRIQQIYFIERRSLRQETGGFEWLLA